MATNHMSSRYIDHCQCHQCTNASTDETPPQWFLRFEARIEARLSAIEQSILALEAPRSQLKPPRTTVRTYKLPRIQKRPDHVPLSVKPRTRFPSGKSLVHPVPRRKPNAQLKKIATSADTSNRLQRSSLTSKTQLPSKPRTSKPRQRAESSFCSDPSPMHSEKPAASSAARRKEARPTRKVEEDLEKNWHFAERKQSVPSKPMSSESQPKKSLALSFNRSPSRPRPKPPGALTYRSQKPSEKRRIGQKKIVRKIDTTGNTSLSKPKCKPVKKPLSAFKHKTSICEMNPPMLSGGLTSTVLKPSQKATRSSESVSKCDDQEAQVERESIVWIEYKPPEDDLCNIRLIA